MKLRYFTESDFINATPPCTIQDMDPITLAMLDVARERSGYLAHQAGTSCVYIINSAYRSVDYEKSKGRAGGSSHTGGFAVDIKAETSRDRFFILAGLLHAGFKRIGIGKNFIHTDTDPSKDDKVIFHYY